MEKGGKDKLGERTTKNLLCSTENTTQYSVTTYMGKNVKKSRYMRITDSLCCLKA